MRDRDSLGARLGDSIKGHYFGLDARLVNSRKRQGNSRQGQGRNYGQGARLGDSRQTSGLGTRIGHSRQRHLVLAQG